jgi:hypothetical protein
MNVWCNIEMCFDSCFLDNFQLVTPFNPQCFCCCVVENCVCVCNAVSITRVCWYICLKALLYMSVLDLLHWFNPAEFSNSWHELYFIHNLKVYSKSTHIPNFICLQKLLSTKCYDSRSSFSSILHHANHMKKQGRLLLATIVTDYMWKLYMKYLYNIGCFLLLGRKALAKCSAWCSSSIASYATCRKGLTVDDRNRLNNSLYKV